MTVEVVSGACYCLCGGMFRFRIRDANAKAHATRLGEMFWEVHAGDGHGWATAQQAARARRREEDEAEEARRAENRR